MARKAAPLGRPGRRSGAGKRRPGRAGKHGVLKHAFISGAHNAYRPHFFRLPTMVALAGMVFALFILALAMERLVIQSPSAQVGAVVASVLVDLTNEDRAAEGLAHLTINPTLVAAAQEKANDMAARSYFSHDTPDGEKPWAFFKRAGYQFRYAGENLAVYFSDSVEVERAWMNSPTHRANILSDNFTEIGIALAQGQYEGHDTVFVVQMFGRPAASAATVTASTESPSSGGGEEITVAGAQAEAAPEVKTIVEDDTFIAVEAKDPNIAASERLADTTKQEPIGAIRGEPNAEPFWKVLTAPKTLLTYIYILIGSLVMVALLFLVFIEFRRHTVASILYGFGLLFLMGGLALAGWNLISAPLQIL